MGRKLGEILLLMTTLFWKGPVPHRVGILLTLLQILHLKLNYPRHICMCVRACMCSVVCLGKGVLVAVAGMHLMLLLFFAGFCDFEMDFCGWVNDPPPDDGVEWDWLSGESESESVEMFLPRVDHTTNSPLGRSLQTTVL